MNNELKTLKETGVNVVDRYVSLLNAIKEGELDDSQILNTLVINEQIIKAAEEFKSAVKNYVIVAMGNVTDKTVYETSDYTIKQTTSATRYDYSKSEDWVAADKNVKLATQDRKNIEKQMQILGEAVKVGGGERTVSITLKK